MNSLLSIRLGHVQIHGFLSLLFVLSFAALCVAAPEYGINIPIPPVVHSNLVIHFEGLTRRTYPQVDKTWLERAIADKCPATNCHFRAYGNRCELSDWWFDDRNGLKMYWNMTSGQTKIGTDDSMPGEPAMVDRENPLTLEEGRPIAETIFNRVREMMTLGKEMKFEGQSAPDPNLPSSEDRNVWMYSWGASDKLGLGASVTITVRARDGRVLRVKLQPSWQELMGIPPLTREMALEKAKTLPKAIDEKYLSLSVRYYYAERRLVWQYMPPPVPMGRSINFGVWDAMTGELLESDSFNGGTRYKPWRNPEFFFEPTEANVKANLEKNLKKWAEELERKAKAASPATEVKQSDSK